MKVLIVDDSSFIRERLISELLEIEEIEIVGEAKDGTEAKEAIFKLDPELVTLDIRMPGMDGVEAFRVIKKLNPRALVIMMTGFAVEEKIKEALKLGATDYLTKPIDIDEILTIAQVAQYLNLHQLTVYKLVKQGNLPAFKVGGQWRFPKKVLDRWIRQEIKRKK